MPNPVSLHWVNIFFFIKSSSSYGGSMRQSDQSPEREKIQCNGFTTADIAKALFCAQIKEDFHTLPDKERNDIGKYVLF